MITKGFYPSIRSLLLLTGEPGVGKSAIAAQLIQIRQYITAYDFYRDSDVEIVRPGRILRSLAAQLAEKPPDYREALVNSIKPELLQVGVKIDIESVVNGINTKIPSTNSNLSNKCNFSKGVQANENS